MLDKKFYKIWSIEHSAWWRADHRGYTKKRTEAGLYSYQEAVDICTSANIAMRDVPNETMVEVAPRPEAKK